MGLDIDQAAYRGMHVSAEYYPQDDSWRAHVSLSADGSEYADGAADAGTLEDAIEYAFWDAEKHLTTDAGPRGNERSEG